MASIAAVTSRQPARVTTARRRYLALVFPWLPVEGLRATRPHLFAGRDRTPLALTIRDGRVVRLIAVDHAAAAAGLASGLTLAQAQAMVPELEVFAHDPPADCDWLERLADGCLRYSPLVVADPPDGITIDIAGCDQAFADERGLATDVEERFARRGVLVRHAFGDTPAIARALARFAGAPAPDERGAVRRLPVAALELDEETTAALARAGLKSLGDVMARPLASLAAQFGTTTAAAARDLAGEVAVPLVPRRAIPPITTERRFAEPLTRGEDALAVLGELAAEAAARLAQRHQGGRCWEAWLFRADGEVRRLRLETAAPTRDTALLGRRWRERLDALADPLDLGFGYDLVRLDVTLAERLDASQLGLDGGAAAAREGEVAGAVDRPPTSSRPARVRRHAPRDRRLPEQAELTLPPTMPAPAAVAWPMHEPGAPPPRPIHLFDPPQRIEASMAEVPDGLPGRFRWRGTLHEVARAAGPERITGERWRDAAGPERDYYWVEDRRGRRFWLFRHGRLDGDDGPPPRWYVHGLFA